MTAVQANGRERALRHYRAAWRWHLYAGLAVLPFLLTLATTGLVMVYCTTFETPEGPRLAVTPGPSAIAPSALLATAQAKVPSGEATQFVPPQAATDVARVVFDTGRGPVMVELDPYRNRVLRVTARDETAYAWAHRIHGTLLLGDVGDFIVETVAGLALLMVVTGLYMWRLRQRPAQAGTSRRQRWRFLHRTTGLYAALGLCFFILSGLAWTNIWGGRLVQAWGSFPAEKWGPVNLSGDGHNALNHGSAREVPWGLEQTPLPQSAHRDGTPLPLDAIVERAGSVGFGPRYRINLPPDKQGVFTISANTMTGDARRPGEERTAHLDQYSGEVVAEARFADYSPLAKSMALGVGLHQGSLGLWNSALNALACAVLIFLCLSGAWMWWLRRPARAGRLVAPPPPAGGLPRRNSLTVLLLCCGIAVPLLGLALLAGLGIARLLQRRGVVG